MKFIILLINLKIALLKHSNAESRNTVLNIHIIYVYLMSDIYNICLLYCRVNKSWIGIEILSYQIYFHTIFLNTVSRPNYGTLFFNLDKPTDH